MEVQRKEISGRIQNTLMEKGAIELDFGERARGTQAEGDGEGTSC